MGENPTRSNELLRYSDLLSLVSRTGSLKGFYVLWVYWFYSNSSVFHKVRISNLAFKQNVLLPLYSLVTVGVNWFDGRSQEFKRRNLGEFIEGI